MWCRPQICFKNVYVHSFITACIRQMGKVIVSVCLSVHTPSPSHNTSTGTMSFLGVTPVTGPSSFLGIPVTGTSSLSRGNPTLGLGYPTPRGTHYGYPSARDEVPPVQVKMWVPGMRYSPVWSGQGYAGWGTPQSGQNGGTQDGVPQPEMGYLPG